MRGKLIKKGKMREKVIKKGGNKGNNLKVVKLEELIKKGMRERLIKNGEMRENYWGKRQKLNEAKLN